MDYHGVKEVISSANIELLYAPRIVVNLVTAAMGSADLFLLSWGFSITSSLTLPSENLS